MATLARWQATVVDAAGNVLSGASVTVRVAATGVLASIYSDRAGATPLSNPFTADANGFAAFYALGSEYQITAVSGGNTIVLDYVPVGLAGAYDVGTASGNLIKVSDADARYLQLANNLNDLANVTTARTNLGLGTAALVDTGTGAANVPTITLADARYLQLANNLSDLASAVTARTNLGLGSAAILNTGTGAGDVLTVGTGDGRYITNASLALWGGSTNLVTVGTITTGGWHGTKISEAYGGTNQSTYTLGDILYSSAANTLSKLAGNTTSSLKILGQTGTGTVSAAPSWVSITSIVSGSDKQIQFNDGGALAGASGLTWDKANNVLALATASSRLAIGQADDGVSALGVTGNAYVTGTVRITGNVGVGVAPSTSINLAVASSITGATTSRAVDLTGALQSGVTTLGAYVRGVSSTAAASFTLADLRVFEAAQGTFGAGSTVTNQSGFYAGSTLTGATNNYGFYGNIASGSNRWNLYMAGTALNYLNGRTLFGSNSDNGGDAVQVSGSTWMSGALGIGGSASSSTAAIQVTKSLTASTGYGLNFAPSVAASVTGALYCVNSSPSTVASAFTLPFLLHFLASPGTFGAGSAVTNQYGFYADSNLTGATNNYGFYGGIAAAANRWNLYMAGTAANYFAGLLDISPSTAGQIKFPATQNASANANTFDDYTEGTKTVAFAPTTSGSITINSSFNTISYTKMGNRVLFSGELEVTSVSSPVGYVDITGLPYTCASGASSRSSVSITLDGLSTTIASAAAQITEGGTSIRIYDGGSGNLAVIANHFQAGSKVCINGNYPTA